MGKGVVIKHNSRAEIDGRERIFGDKKADGGKFVWDDEKKKFVKFADRAVIPKIHIINDITPFISPITRQPIRNRSQLREHNKVHGVTDSRDYGPEYYEKAEKKRAASLNSATPEDKAHRIESLKQAVEKHERR